MPPKKRTTLTTRKQQEVKGIPSGTSRQTRSSAVSINSTLGEQKNRNFKENVLKSFVNMYMDNKQGHSIHKMAKLHSTIPRTTVYNYASDMDGWIEDFPDETADQIFARLLRLKPGPERQGNALERKSILWLIDLYTLMYQYKPDMENVRIIVQKVLGKKREKSIDRAWVKHLFDEAPGYSASFARKQEVAILRSKNTNTMIDVLARQTIYAFNLDGDSKTRFEKFIKDGKNKQGKTAQLKALRVKLPTDLSETTSPYPVLFSMDEMSDSIGPTRKLLRWGSTNVPTVEPVIKEDGVNLSTMTIMESKSNRLLAPIFIGTRKTTPIDFFDWADENATYLYAKSGGTTIALMPLIVAQVIKLLPPERPAFGLIDWTGVHHSVEAMQLFADNDVHILPIGGRTGVWLDPCDAEEIHGKIHDSYTAGANERGRLTDGQPLLLQDKVELVTNAQMTVSQRDVHNAFCKSALPCKESKTLGACWGKALDLISKFSIDHVDLDLKVKKDFGVLYQELPEACKAGFGERLTEAVDAAR
jgi:hypothetical protein